MTRHTILFSFLAVSLAALSLSMAPRQVVPPSDSPAIVAPAMAQTGPMHALTGVSFHTIAVGY
jgi:hypothetical protein